MQTYLAWINGHTQSFMVDFAPRSVSPTHFTQIIHYKLNIFEIKSGGVAENSNTCVDTF